MDLALAIAYLIFTFFRPQNILTFMWGWPMVDIIGGLSIALLVFAFLEGSARRLGKQIQVILVLMCIGAILTNYALETHYARFMASISLLILVFLPFLLACYAATSRLKIDIMLWTIILALIPCAVNCWMMHHSGVGLAGREPILDGTTGELVIRVKGWGIFDGPNETATIMIIGAVLCFSYVNRFLFTKPYISILAAPLVYYFGMAFWWTNSRQAVVFAAAGLYGLFAKLKTGRQLITFILVSAALWGMISVSARWAGGVGDRASRRRGQAMTQGIRVWKQHPILGVGKGRAYDYLGIKMPAHNSYIEVLVDTGMAGFAPYVGIAAVSIAQLLLLTRVIPETKEDKAELALGRQLMAFSLVVAVAAFFQNRAYSLDYFICFGLCSGYGNYMVRKYGDVMPKPFHIEWHKKWLWVWLPAVGIIGLFGLHFAARFYWALV